MSSQEAITENVKVVVRCRHLNKREIDDGYERIVDMFKDKGLIEVRKPELPAEPPKSFTFDSVYDWNSKQRELYGETLHGLVQSAIEGYNGTIFAYGQTTMGKTFTMQGITDDPEQRGVIQQAFEHIFQHVSQSENQNYLIRASYIELYNEKITDLLSRDYHNKLQIKERPDTGVYIKDLSYFVTSSIKEMEHVLHLGNTNRMIGQTQMGQVSSRAATVFTIHIECKDGTEAGGNGIRVGRLNLVELHGSERPKKTASEGARLREATRISMSLSPLSNVVTALTDEKCRFVPYRNSKLTRLSQDALGGKGKTVIVAHVGPSSQHYDETISTLRFTQRARHIKNRPKINVVAKDSLLQEFQEEIERLKADIEVIGITRRVEKTTNETDEMSMTYESEDDCDLVENELEQRKQSLLNNEALTYESEDDCDLVENELEQRKQSLLNNEENEKLQQEVKNEEEILKYERELIYGKIKAMESRILTGKQK